MVRQRVVAQAHRCGYRGGSGPPLLLLHGAFHTWRAWKAAIPDLERSFEVLAPTLLGHLGRDRFAAGVVAGIESLADDLERALDEAAWDTAHIAGASLGGLLALELAQRGRARSVVALAPGGDRPSSKYAEKRIELIFTVTHAIARGVLPHAERVCASAQGRRLLCTWACAHPERLQAAEAAHAVRALARCPGYVDLKRALPPATPRDLDNVRCPVLLAWSTKDRVLPFKRYGPAYREALPSAELRMLDDVGHLAMMDDPRQIATLIRDFAARAENSASFTAARLTTR
jgi:pimeloyl-ACP methyl ester carboxylesterase